jgi:hypothetical protein
MVNGENQDVALIGETDEQRAQHQVGSQVEGCSSFLAQDGIVTVLMEGQIQLAERAWPGGRDLLKRNRTCGYEGSAQC